MAIKVIDQKGKSVGEVDLNKCIFEVEPNDSVVFEAIIRQRAGKRQVLMLLRIDQLLAVVVRNLGSKRVQDVLVKDLLEHHNGVVVVLYLAQLLAHIKLICPVKHVA